MTKATIATALIFLLAHLIAAGVYADDPPQRMAGRYASLGVMEREITLELKEHGEAVIEIDDKQQEVVTVYVADWRAAGEGIHLQYNQKSIRLVYDDKVPLDRFGVDEGIPGIYIPGSVTNSGVFGHTPLWKIERLARLPLLTKYRLKLHGLRLSEDDYDTPLMLALSPGLVFLVMGMVLALQRVFFAIRAKETAGEVVAISARLPILHQSDFFRFSPQRHLPEILYMDETGKPCSFVGGYGSSLLLSNDIGEKVTVLYIPQHPGRAKIKNGFLLYGPAILCLVLGTAAMLPFLMV